MRLRFLLLTSATLAALWSCQAGSKPARNEVAPAPAESTSTAADPGSESASATSPESDASLAPNPQPAPARSQDGGLGQDRAQIEILRQRQEALSKAYVDRGNELLERGDLEGALRQFADALDVMSTNQAARDGMRRVQALLGDSFAQAGEMIQDEAGRAAVRRAQARLSAEQAANQGDAPLRAGNYAQAAQRYREAQLILRYHPLIATDSLDEQLITGKLEEASRMAAEAADEAARQARSQAEELAAAKERDQREYRQNKLQTLYSRANEAFLSDRYGEAEALANQILLEDPSNEAAEQLRITAQAARHARRNEKTRRDYREQWRRTFDELDTMDVIQTDTIDFDPRRWRDVSQRQPLEFSSTDAAADANKQAVVDRLESTRFAVRFLGPSGDGSPLTEVAAYLQNLTGVNFRISSAVSTDLDEEETTVRLDLDQRSVRKVLDIIAETKENLRWKIADGMVHFVTKEEMLGGQVLRMYEVRDIIHPVPNFAAREINVSPSGGLEQPDEELDEREGLVVTSDALEGLIRDNVAPASWEEDPRNSIRIADNGTLVVYQTPEVHDQIQSLLEDLREATGIMVDIQARFLNVEDNFLEDIGVDFRGLGQPGLGTNRFFDDFGEPTTQGDLGKEIGNGTDLGAFFDDNSDGELKGRVENLYDIALGDQDVLVGSGGLSFQWTYLDNLQVELILRAVSKSERVELVTNPRLLVFNTARANIAILNQVAYVQDFDVEIAQAASIADPIINVVQDGVVLDVRPVVSADRRFILMELRPTVATLRRPIREQTTTLGSQNSVTIQLPEVDIQRLRTTVPMPDGGTVLLGGLKVSEKQDLQSGIPIINKIPVVKFLFERKGTYVSNRKLLILLKANIVIPSESEPTPAQMGLGN